MSGHVHIPTHEYPPCRGGIAFYVEETALAAARLGWTAQVYAPAGIGCAEGVESCAGVQVHRLPLSGNQNWPDRWCMRTRLSAAQPTVESSVLLLAEPGPLRLWSYAGLLRLPQPQRLVVVLHGSEYLRLRAVPHRRWLLTRLLRTAHKIGVVSDFVGNRVRLGNPECADRICRVPGALRSGFVSGLTARGVDQSRHHGPKKAFHVLSVGRLHPRKGQLLSAQALAALPVEVRARIRWCVAGPTVDRAYERQVLSVAGSAGVHVERHANIDDAGLLDLYLGCHLLLFTPVTLAHSVEGLGLVSLEAAACGLPILASASGGVAEGLSNGENALLVAENDAPAITSALQELMQSPDLLQRFANAGPAVAARFSWQDNVHRLLG